ncbi:MFS transporter [Egicoccus sp. AB-alg6-2]|uniref:MFS transporter n=1 Tax=Egicoccus sp. AB-alg6-2 TaxID=3242692 RepID=UPI00359DD914
MRRQLDDQAETPVSYLDVLRSRWALVSAATLLYWTGAHALRPLLPLRLDDLGANEALIGVVLALFPLSALGLAIPGGRLVDRIGVRRVLLGGFGGMVLLGLGFARASTTAMVAFLTAGIGLSELATWISLQAMASAGGRGRFLTKQLAVFSLAWGGGLAFGPVVGAALYDRHGFGAVGVFYLACGAISIVLIGLAPRVTASSRGTPGSIRSGVQTMWASGPVRATLLSSFVALFVGGVKGSFFPLYLERAGLSIPRIGLILSIMGVASLVIRMPLPWLLRRLGARAVLLVSMWLAIVPMTLVPFIHGFWAWATLAVLSSLGLGVNPPVTVELMARHTDRAERGLAMGLRLTANRIGQVIQPMLFGGMVAVTGFAGAFAAGGLLLAGITAWTHQVRFGRSAA